MKGLCITLLVCMGFQLSAGAQNRATDTSGTESAVLTPYYHEKSNYYRFEHLRSGASRTSNGWWNVQDFAYTMFNPNSEEVTITLKMISDDPKFVFADGQTGTYTKVFHIKPMFGISENVYICPSFEVFKPDWPVSSRSNFTGAVEASSIEPFYFFFLHETPEGISPDLVKAYFIGWDESEYDEPAVWDKELNQFVIQYTNYWHDEDTWRVGWYSVLELRNNSDEAVTYTLTHIPYYGGQYDPKTRQVDKYSKQVIHLKLQPHEMKTSTLMELFGWGDKMSSMEGALLINPDRTEAKIGTNATLLIVPNNSGEPLHATIQ